ncbi:hypothetical protein EYF80_028643 [Liparis tanakae]|uniref:Uncharacterized protein n=1 Tax=Liparis tanakae TaxID=230148 RepID=A0A4Z2H7C4_9TELE|nr:hypothetical protein EYF80_028643 [Liparis tanakae]
MLHWACWVTGYLSSGEPSSYRTVQSVPDHSGEQGLLLQDNLWTVWRRKEEKKGNVMGSPTRRKRSMKKGHESRRVAAMERCLVAWPLRSTLLGFAGLPHCDAPAETLTRCYGHKERLHGPRLVNFVIE